MRLINSSDLPLILDQPYSVLEDVEIDGTNADPACEFGIYVHADYCTVRNVFIHNMPRIGIGVRGVTGTLIEGANVGRSGMQGIWVERDCVGANIKDSCVINSGKDNIQIAGVNGSVINCRVEGAGNGQPNFAGIYVAANSRNMLVSGNTCTRNGTGIDCSWGFQEGENRNCGPISCGNIISANRCFQNNSCGIACASNGTIISLNQCLENGLIPNIILSSGIGLVNANNCILSENMLFGSRVGLLFMVNGAGTNASKNCIVTNNHFEGNADFPVRQYFSRALSQLPATRGHIFANNFGAS